MKWRKHRRPPAPEEIRARNRELIFKGAKPTLRDRTMLLTWAVEDFWCRHITHRELYRRLDSLRTRTR